MLFQTDVLEKKKTDKNHTRWVKQECTKLWQSPGVDGFLSIPFAQEELVLALSQLKSGKHPHIPPDVLLQCSSRKG